MESRRTFELKTKLRNIDYSLANLERRIQSLSDVLSESEIKYKNLKLLRTLYREKLYESQIRDRVEGYC